MPGLEVRSFDSPDETRPFVDKGGGDIVTVGGHPVLHATFEPGWRWSEHVRPIAQTESCQPPHLLDCISGRMTIRMDDGTEWEIGPGGVASVSPGHDDWVDEDGEPCVMADFGGYTQYAQRS